MISFLQFHAYYLHLYNIAATSEVCLRHVDELQHQLSAAEEKSAAVKRGLQDKTAELGRRSTEAEELKVKSRELSFEVGLLHVKVAQSNDRLKVSKDRNLEKDKQIALLCT